MRVTTSPPAAARDLRRPDDGSPAEERRAMARLPEAERNRLLRRADWRFLLPDPAPSVSVCFTGGRLAGAVAAISERTLDPRHAAPGACDLAVVRDPDAAILQKMWTALRPGGACYIEWSLPVIGGARGVRRRLAACGFEDAVCSWAWPPPALRAASVWLPVDEPGPMRHYVRDRPSVCSWANRLARALARLGWPLGRRLGLIAPLVVTAQRPSTVSDGRPPLRVPQVAPTCTDEPQALPSYVYAPLRAGWESWRLGPLPDRLSWLLLTGGARSGNKAVGLVFGEPARRPHLAVKLARVPEAVPALATEAAALRAIEARRPGGIAGIPRLLFLSPHAEVERCEPRCRHGGHPATRQRHPPLLVETALTGVPLTKLLHSKNRCALALRATDWLATLAHEMGRPPAPRSAWWGRLVEPVLAAFSDGFGSVADPGMLRDTCALLATLSDLPLVCEQRDFAPWNVLVGDAGGLAVHDWESAEVEGLPALDLIYFLTYLAFFADGAMRTGRYLASYRAVRDPSTPLGALQAECLGRYCRLTGLEPAAVRPLRLLTWLLHARSEHARLVADAGGAPDRDALRRSLFLRLWAEELRSDAAA